MIRFPGVAAFRLPVRTQHAQIYACAVFSLSSNYPK